MSEIVEIKKQMAAMAAQLKALTKALKPVGKSSGKKASKSSDSESESEPKPKKDTEWGRFTARVRGLLVEAKNSFERAPELLQFCSALKAKKAMDEWDNDEILEERDEWVRPEKSKQELAGKNKRPPSANASANASVASKSDKEEQPEDEESDEEEEKEPTPKPQPKKKEEKKVEKKVEEKPAPKKEEPAPKKEVKKETKKPAEEEWDGELEAWTHKGKNYTKTSLHDVVDEDNYSYVGRYDADKDTINKKHPMPAYIKKMLVDLKAANEE